MNINILSVLVVNLIFTFYFYTNHESIYGDMLYNNNIYRSNNIKRYMQLIDYVSLPQTFEFKSNIMGICVINLSKIHTNVINVIESNKYIIPEIIIISCDHNDFWNKIKLFKSYSIKSRKQFTSFNSFVTVTHLVKNIVSLGYNCSVSFYLKDRGLKLRSYPFDWIKLSLNNTIKILELDFKDFTTFKVKCFSNKHKHLTENNTGSYVLENIYSKTLAHECETLDDITALSSAMLRRIKRFKKLRNPTFIILINEKQEDSHVKRNINKLKYLLHKLFNTFEIIILYTDKINPPDSPHTAWKHNITFTKFENEDII